MARLAGLPCSLEQLLHHWEISPSGKSVQRFGQWIWNNDGLYGIDGKALEKDGVSLFYAYHEQAVEIMRECYEEQQAR